MRRALVQRPAYARMVAGGADAVARAVAPAESSLVVEPTRPGVSLHTPVLPRRRALARLMLLAEETLVVITMMALGNAVLPVLRPLLGLSGGVYEGSALYKAVLFPLYAVYVLLSLTMPRRIIEAAAHRPTLLALVGLTVASIAWSADPAVTLRRSTIIVLTTIVGLYLSVRFAREELLRLLATACGISAVLSVLWSLGAPAQGVMLVDGGLSWLGVFGHKNALGRFMVMSALLFLLLTRRPGTQRIAVAGALLSIALITLSRSASALLTLVVLIAELPLFALWMSRHRAAFLALTLGVMLTGAGALVMSANSEIVLASVGKDTTLTGRTGLWESVWWSVQERPWLGYGHGAFWTGWQGASRAVLEIVGWETPHAHNGILDLGLSLGALGVALFLMGFVAAFARALALAREERTWHAVWPAVFLSFMVLYNITESTILREHSLFWMLYVATVVDTPGVRALRGQSTVPRPGRPHRRAIVAIGDGGVTP